MQPRARGKTSGPEEPSLVLDVVVDVLVVIVVMGEVCALASHDSSEKDGWNTCAKFMDAIST
jgi:hypothetical protein